MMANLSPSLSQDELSCQTNDQILTPGTVHIAMDFVTISSSRIDSKTMTIMTISKLLEHLLDSQTSWILSP